MNIILNKIYGESIKEEPFKFPVGTPAFILYGYKAEMLTWNGRECLLVRPTGNITLPTIRKQLKKIEEITSLPTIIHLDKLSSLQRTNMINNETAFLLDSGQLFIPFWGSYFEEKIKTPMQKPQKMTANAQLVFLHLVYENISLKSPKMISEIAHDLNMPKSTCTRAIQVLRNIGAIDVEQSGTSKRIFLKNEAQEILNEMKEYMVSPVQKTIYLREMPPDISFKIGGLKALSDKTMISIKESDGAYAVGFDDFLDISDDLIIEEQDYESLGGAVVEKWIYNPNLLSGSKYVDDISLILSLKDNSDERIQGELNKLRNKYGLEEA